MTTPSAGPAPRRPPTSSPTRRRPRHRRQPRRRPPAGGSAVTVTGTGFSGASAVTSAPSPPPPTPSPRAPRSPPPRRPSRPAPSTSPSPRRWGPAPPLLPTVFTYESRPTVTAVSPDAGPPAGATPVTITGTNFTGASAVNFGSTAGRDLHGRLGHLDHRHLPGRPAGARSTSPSPRPRGPARPASADQFTYRGRTDRHRRQPGRRPAGRGHHGDDHRDRLHRGQRGRLRLERGHHLHGHLAHLDHRHLPGRGRGHGRRHRHHPGGTSASQPAGRPVHLRGARPTVSAVSPVPAAGRRHPGDHHRHRLHRRHAPSTSAPWPATSFTVASATSVTAALARPSRPGTVDVTVTTPGGHERHLCRRPVHLRGRARPSPPSARSPACWPAAPVTITGTGFTGASAVELRRHCRHRLHRRSRPPRSPPPRRPRPRARSTSPSPPRWARAPSRPADQFTYEAAPTVTAISPVAGPPPAGTVGHHHRHRLHRGHRRRLRARRRPPVHRQLRHPVTATSPAGAAGTVDVTVTTPAGTSATSPADQFTYEAAPTVTAVSPVAGPDRRAAPRSPSPAPASPAPPPSTSASSAATSYTVISATQITAISPAGPPGTVDVTVTTLAGTSATARRPTSSPIEARPTVTVVSPAAGLARRRHPGDHHRAPASPAPPPSTSARTAATSSPSTRPPRSPPPRRPERPGTVDVTVVTPAAPAPPRSPTSSPTRPRPPSPPQPGGRPDRGRHPVTITGTDFTAASAVSFGTAAATITGHSATPITATAPAEAAGTVDVTVDHARRDQRHLAGGPVHLRSARRSPASARSPGRRRATTVTITGTNFTGATAVDFGATPATDLSVVSPTSITATSPGRARRARST